MCLFFVALDVGRRFVNVHNTHFVPSLSRACSETPPFI